MRWGHGSATTWSRDAPVPAAGQCTVAHATGCLGPPVTYVVAHRGASAQTGTSRPGTLPVPTAVERTMAVCAALIGCSRGGPVHLQAGDALRADDGAVGDACRQHELVAGVQVHRCVVLGQVKADRPTHHAQHLFVRMGVDAVDVVRAVRPRIGLQAFTRVDLSHLLLSWRRTGPAVDPISRATGIVTGHGASSPPKSWSGVYCRGIDVRLGRKSPGSFLALERASYATVGGRSCCLDGGERHSPDYGDHSPILCAEALPYAAFKGKDSTQATNGTRFTQGPSPLEPSEHIVHVKVLASVYRGRLPGNFLVTSLVV